MAETATEQGFDLEKELQVVLDRVEDAQKADLFAKFMVEQILPPLRDAWRVAYLDIEPKIENHLLMQQRLAALEEIQRALEGRAARIQQDYDEAANILGELRQGEPQPTRDTSIE